MQNAGDLLDPGTVPVSFFFSSIFYFLFFIFFKLKRLSGELVPVDVALKFLWFAKILAWMTSALVFSCYHNATRMLLGFDNITSLQLGFIEQFEES